MLLFSVQIYVFFIKKKNRTSQILVSEIKKRTFRHKNRSCRETTPATQNHCFVRLRIMEKKHRSELPLAACHQPEAWLEHVAEVVVTVGREVVAFDIGIEVTAGVTEAQVEQTVGRIGLCRGGSCLILHVTSHSLQPAIGERCTEAFAELGIETQHEFVAQVVERITGGNDFAIVVTLLVQVGLVGSEGAQNALRTEPFVEQ